MILALPLGVLIGLAVGLLGGGGSVLAVPVLVHVLGQDVHEATTASLAVVAAAALAAAVMHAREATVCRRHATVVSIAALPAIAGGTLAGGAVGGTVILVAFGIVMLAAATRMWSAAADSGRASASASPLCPPVRMARDVTTGLVLGGLTGFLGVGGGFLVVPALMTGLGLAVRSAIGTSLAIVGATSLAGLAIHLLAGRAPDAGVTVALAVACVAGAIAGALLGRRLPAGGLARGFAVLVAAVATGTLAAALL